MAFYNRRKLELQDALEKLEAAENRIRDLESDFQAVEQAVAVLVMTQDGIIERANNRFVDLLGYKPEKLIGQHHRAFCTSNYATSEDYIRFWRELVTGNVKQGSFPAVHADGRDVWLEARYSPVKGEQGVSTRVIALIGGIRESATDFDD
ncbi:methyl-accepting chemotaxis protein [Marinobacter sp. es.048]|uniref:PAS domain-containing protein n=1 Tax=Marinobacter sp. es.048 TaxID=1761795 RepID=UPI000B587999|nr:PAS domain-containing protein [Marinobacter sp. es.048]SNC74693.1 methyl-accepting chemotaxis protein [Marinobacter sp. es.048]